MEDETSDSCSTSNSESEHEQNSAEDSAESSDSDNGNSPRYPKRIRQQRELPGTIPWNAIQL